MSDLTRPRERNALAWLDLQERIDSALHALRAQCAHAPSEWLRGKIAGVEAVQAEQERLSGTQDTSLTLFALWIDSQAEALSAPHLKARRAGYRLVLDYIRSY